MDREALVAHCLADPEAEETYPWGDVDLVAKVGGTVFAFLGRRRSGSRAGGTPPRPPSGATGTPGAITVSSYIGRYGSNAVDFTGPVPEDEMRELVAASYDAIVAALPRPAGPAEWQGPHREPPGRERRCALRDRLTRRPSRRVPGSHRGGEYPCAAASSTRGPMSSGAAGRP